MSSRMIIGTNTDKAFLIMCKQRRMYQKTLDHVKRIQALARHVARRKYSAGKIQVMQDECLLGFQRNVGRLPWQDSTEEVFSDSARNFHFPATMENISAPFKSLFCDTGEISIIITTKPN